MRAQGAPRERLVVTAVTLDRELIRQVDALAASEERSRSFVVRRALARELARAGSSRRGAR